MVARPALLAAFVGAVCLNLAGCATTVPGAAQGPTTATAEAHVLPVAASINAWGSVLAQLGGIHVRTTSIITNPDTDPHVYEPTPADGRTIADARLFVENSIGYDPWAARALVANPDSTRLVTDVGQVTGIAAGGNPHRWYAPADVERVADAITADLIRLDPADTGYFHTQRTFFQNVALAPYHHLLSAIRARYAGTAVGASESIATPLAEALGLDLRTPTSFLRAISEGTEPSAADKATIDDQINRKLLKVYILNTQNATPDVAAQVTAAKAHHIVVTGLTETLAPAHATFQDWQVNQLLSLQAALAQATGR